MAKYKNGSHTVYDIKYHFVWITKYRYKILKGNVAFRLRELLKQGCEAYGIKIIKGGIQQDHVHMLLSCPTNMAPSISFLILEIHPVTIWTLFPLTFA